MSSALQPNRPSTFLKNLAACLAHDETRIRPPISLPGRPASATAITTPPPPKLRPPPHLECGSTLCRREAEPEDHRLPYSREELLEMDRRFGERLERAFALGLERRTSAGRRLRR